MTSVLFPTYAYIKTISYSDMRDMQRMAVTIAAVSAGCTILALSMLLSPYKAVALIAGFTFLIFLYFVGYYIRVRDHVSKIRAAVAPFHARLLQIDVENMNALRLFNELNAELDREPLGIRDAFTATMDPSTHGHLVALKQMREVITSF